MSWKKNGFSYVMWLVYTLFAVGVLLIMAEMLSGRLLTRVPFGGLVLWLGIMGLSGIMVFLMHRIANRKRIAIQESVNFKVIVEAAAAVLLLIFGLILRVDGISSSGEMAGYYEAAKVAEGQHIPQVVHGATYFYLQLLHTIFLFLGNKFLAAVWLQIILQLAAALLLFSAMRKLAGSLAALVTLGFLMFADYMVKGALTLSPQMLYLFLFAIGLTALAACQNNQNQKLHPGQFLAVGIWIGLVGYLDLGGLLLLVLLAAQTAGEREEKERLEALGAGLGGALLGLLGAMAADAFLSGKNYGDVLTAWLELYQPGFFRFPVTQLGGDVSWWSIMLEVLLVAGIFSFWCDRKRDYLSIWVLGICITIAAGSFGMFTEEVPVSLYLFLFFTALAGVAVGEALRKPVMEKAVEASQTEPKADLAEKKLSLESETGEMASKESVEQPESEKSAKPAPRYLENPLPLPKPHVKKVMDYDRVRSASQDDFDYPVSDNDDFDI